MKIDIKGYDTIIFDLGGVLLNIDYQRSAKAFTALGVSDFDRVYSQAKQERLFDDYETGKITSEEFLGRLVHWCRPGTSAEMAKDAWNAMLLDFPRERLDILKKLSGSHRLFLLSNTNDIHITAYKEYLKETFGFTCLDAYFEKQYYSYELGLRKPDKEIFDHVLAENNLDPTKTFFIDDSIQHVEGASSAGINAFHLLPGKTISTVFP